MDNNDLSRTMGKNETYYKIRSAVAQISARLKKRITVKEFLLVAARKLLSSKDIDANFK